VGAYLAKVTVVTNVVTYPIFFDIGEHLFIAAELFSEGECLQNGAGVSLASSNVIDFGDTGSFDEFPDETCDVLAVDIIANLFPLVSENLIFAVFQVAFDEI